MWLCYVIIFLADNQIPLSNEEFKKTNNTKETSLAVSSNVNNKLN